MADNVQFQTAVTATPPAATLVASDDVSGVQFQRVKLDVGGDGVSVPVIGTIPLGTVQVQGTVRTVIGAATGENFFGTLFTTGVTNGTLVPAPAQGTYIRVFDMMVSGSAAGTAFVEFGDGTAFVPGVFAAGGGFVFNSARGVRTHGTAQDILFNAAAGTWGVSVNYALEN